MSITIKDIARRAGVSHATVSLVLSQDPRITAATRAKVWRAARRLNYVPNLAARNLRRGESRLLGFVVNDIANPFYGLMVQSAEAAALERGYQLLLADSQWDAAREVAAVEKLVSLQTRGVLLCGTEQTDRSLALLNRVRLPVIVVDTCPASYQGAFVGNDVVAAGRVAAAHLLEIGCRRPVFLTAARSLQGFSGFVQLRRGFIETLRQRRVPRLRQAVVAGGLTVEDGRAAFHRLRAVESTVDGVFCANDLCALGVLAAADEAGLKVGRDLAVMGIDDLPISCVPRISLTSIRQPSAQIARTAMQVLIDSLERGQPPRLRQTFLPELVVRQSTRRR